MIRSNLWAIWEGTAGREEIRCRDPKLRNEFGNELMHSRNSKEARMYSTQTLTMTYRKLPCSSKALGVSGPGYGREADMG